jgi:hypothetical protein
METMEDNWAPATVSRWNQSGPAHIVSGYGYTGQLRRKHQGQVLPFARGHFDFNPATQP